MESFGVTERALCTSHVSLGFGRPRVSGRRALCLQHDTEVASCRLSGGALGWHRQKARARVRPCRTTAHTTTSLSEQISLSFRLSPNRNVAAVEGPPPIGSSNSRVAAQDATKQPSEQAAGQAATLLAASIATSASHVTVLT